MTNTYTASVPLSAFKSRFFQSGGDTLSCVIDEFQCEKWRIGDTNIPFWTNIGAGSRGLEHLATLKALAEDEPSLNLTAREFPAFPVFAQDSVTCTIAVSEERDPGAKRPLGVIAVKFSILQARSGRPSWCYNVEILGVAQFRQSKTAFDLYATAALSDIIYDEMRIAMREVKQGRLYGDLRVNIFGEAKYRSRKAMFMRLRDEIHAIRYLLNSDSSLKRDDSTGLLICPSVDT